MNRSLDKWRDCTCQFFYFLTSKTMEPAPKKIKFMCVNCKKIFDRAERLQAHQKQCDLCEQVLCGVKSYNHHRKTAHAVRPTKCDTCTKEFPKHRDLLQHQKNPIFNGCGICKKKFCHLSDYNHHQRSVHNFNPTQCTTCEKGFPTQPALEQHQKNSSVTDCDLCYKKFCQLVDYNHHQRSVHNINPT